MSDSEKIEVEPVSNADTPRLNGDVAPSWLVSQGAPTPAETPKAKRTRRTKAQMADAKEAYAKVEQSTIDTLRPPPSLLPIVSEVQEYRNSRLPIVACVVSLFALAVSLVNAVIH